MTEKELVILYEKLHKILGNDTPRKQAEWLMKNRLAVYIIEHLDDFETLRSDIEAMHRLGEATKELINEQLLEE